jgi:hypothetical protein
MGETAALAESGLNHTAVVPPNEVTAPEPETCRRTGSFVRHSSHFYGSLKAGEQLKQKPRMLTVRPNVVPVNAVPQHIVSD